MTNNSLIISVHKHSAGVGAGIVRVRPTLNSHISGALTLKDTLRKNIRKIYFLIFLNFLKKEQFFFTFLQSNQTILNFFLIMYVMCILFLAAYIWKSKKYFFNLEKKSNDF